MATKVNVWDFVEKHYPGYSQSNIIALSDDYDKILYSSGDIEEGDGAHKLLKQWGVDDIDNIPDSVLEEITSEYQKLCYQIFMESIENYLQFN